MGATLYLHGGAASLYGLGLLLSGASAYLSSSRWLTPARVLLPLGLLLHLTALAVPWVQTGVVPTQSLLGVFSLYSFLALIGTCILAIRYRSASVAFSLGIIPLVALLAAMAGGFDDILIKKTPRSFGLGFHIVVVMISFAAYSLSAAAGVLLLLQERSLKRKAFGKLWESLPSLSILDDITYHSMLLGTGALTVGIVSGLLAAPASWGLGWYADSRLLSTVVVWIVYATYLRARASFGWRGRRLALFAVFGFVLTVIAFVFVNMGRYFLPFFT